MLKKTSILTLLMIISLSTVCFADYLPDSEFCLGGISVKGTSTIEYVRSIYGEPQLVSKNDHSAEYRYGDTVKIKTSTFGNERVFFIETTDNNGFSTPSGLAVGMTAEDMLDMYGDPRSERDLKNGGTCYVYGDKYRSGGAGMFIETNKQGIITMIRLIN